MNLDRLSAIRSRLWTGLYFIIAIAILFLARSVLMSVGRRFPEVSLFVGAWGSERISVTNDKSEAVEGATAVYEKASDELRELRALVPSISVNRKESTVAEAAPSVAASLLVGSGQS